jgi:L-rhamnose mutarotase
LDSKTEENNKYIHIEISNKIFFEQLKGKREKSKLAYLKLSNEQCDKWKKSWKSIMKSKNITIQFMFQILNSSPISKLRKGREMFQMLEKVNFFGNCHYV